MNIISPDLIDVFLLLSIVIFILSSHGFIDSFLDFVSFLISLFVAYKLYPVVAVLLLQDGTLPVGIAHAAGFFIAWLISEIILFFITYGFLIRLLTNLRSHPLNKLLRFIPATLHALVMFLFFVSLVFALPVHGAIKASILNSRSGPFFIRYSQTFEKSARNIFGRAVSESINFLTITQGSHESRNLNISVNENKLIYDTESESTMFKMVNDERSKKNTKILTHDPNLRNIGRKYAREMLNYSFFSHQSKIDGTFVSERTTRDGIVFVVIGENLAYAPDVYIAHQGLMNSKGHRENILSEDFGRVGIGVVDAGIWGKMFVQVFTD